MIRARLWYGPAGHGVELERVARYLAGPLGCRVETRMHQRFGRSYEQIVLRDPVNAVIEMDRRPEVSAETVDLLRRLPQSKAPGLGERLLGCTARLEVHDGSLGERLVPATGVCRSVLVPLAFAMGGIVEEVDSGRLLHFPLPQPKRDPLPVKALRGVAIGLDRVLGVLALRPWPEGRPLPGPAGLSSPRLPSPSRSPARPVLLLAPPAPPGSR